jgi:hypothetical protein
VAVAVLAVSASAGVVAGPASADALLVPAGVSTSVSVDIAVPGTKKDADPIMSPDEGPKHEVDPD